MTDSFLHSLAVLALLHEAADESWKAAVARGGAAGARSAAGGADAFVDALAGLVAEEKEQLKAALASGSLGGSTSGLLSGAPLSETVVPAEAVAELRFELGEIRARLESMEVALDTLLRRSEPTSKA